MNMHPNTALASALVLTASLLGCSTAPTLSTAPARPTVPSSPARRYIAADAIDIQAVLRDPPADNSADVRAELDSMLAIQVARTPADLRRMQADGAVSLRLFASVLGPSVKPEALPATEALLASVAGNAQIIINQAKVRWNRPRPWVLDSRIQPCIDKPASASYPSDRAAQSRLCAVVLGELFPAKKAQLLAKADQVGQDRVIAGIHYPSDIQAGKELAQAIAAKIMQTPAFQADVAAARAELAKATP